MALASGFGGGWLPRLRSSGFGEELRLGVTKSLGVLSEMAGRVVLKEVFEAQGYRIVENYPLSLEGVEVELDGYDPDARVGYEYLTQEDGIEPGPLDFLMRQNHCQLFLIDESQVSDAPTMVSAVFEFFRQIERDD